MGQGSSSTEGSPEEPLSLSHSEKTAIRASWQAFCDSHPEPGAFLFSALLDKHPEYQALFGELRDVPRSGLVKVPFYKTHCSAMAKLLSDVVKTLDRPELLADVVRTNALEHATRDVMPLHFEALWQLVEMRVGLAAPGTPAAAASWEKLLEEIQQITLNVYENLGITASTSTAATSLSRTDRSLDTRTREAPNEHLKGVKIKSNASSPKASSPKAGSPKANAQKSSSPKPGLSNAGSPKPSTPKASRSEASSSKQGSPKTRSDGVSPKENEVKSAASGRRWSIFNRSVDKHKDTGAKPSGSEAKGTGSKHKGNK
ncbi:uncharacterized protein [Dermacentor albipictus]|uniref:uncharacterized protein n=1 Tax=Dermacentor albipictus TaxID=60249 RepID=UPI0031FE118F